tara:strand:+ start:220 stop:405 length:186 start_codon:yes stop_codon:yes gene_type:complete
MNTTKPKTTDVLKIAIPFISIVSLVITMLMISSGCGTGHVSCDAYGQNNVDNEIISEGEGS